MIVQSIAHQAGQDMARAGQMGETLIRIGMVMANKALLRVTSPIFTGGLRGRYSSILYCMMPSSAMGVSLDHFNGESPCGQTCSSGFCPIWPSRDLKSDPCLRLSI
jgi:hypothetical protein